jgi:hypothetical protein
MTQKAYDEWVKEFLTSSPEQIDHSSMVKLQDEVFDFSKEIGDLVSTPEFARFSDRIRFTRHFVPEEKAILLTKKGTASFKRGHPAPIKGFAPAIVGSTAELINSRQRELSDGSSYYELLTRLGNLIGALSFPSMKVIDQDPPEGYLDGLLRRHVTLPSPGLKSRTIAIGDYNTQYMLSPIHRWAFECLRQIRSDYTFSHEEGYRQLAHFTEHTDFVACFDLSNATDAFPVKFSEEVLRRVLPGGEAIAHLWTKVMTALPFGNRGYYRRGQPMGLLSSWAVFALSHHFVIWLAAKRAGGNLLRRVLANPDKYYGIVGDDVFITHPALAHYYAIIVVSLGVKINFTKSLIVTSDKRVSEFVKRNSFNGREISAISPGLIIKSFDDYACTRELVLKLRQLSKDSRVLSLYDEVSLCETIKAFNDGFIHRSISILSTVPEVYSGMAPMESRGIWPPSVRFRFLTLKALEILDLNLRGIFIGTNGQDVYNDLVNWLLQDITLEGTFRRTQFYEFMNKHGSKVSDNRLRYRLISVLSEMAATLSERHVSEEEFSKWEDLFLSELEQYVPEQTMSVKAVSRAMTRSYAYKIFRSIREYNELPFETLARIEEQIYNLSLKYSFKLPPTSGDVSPFGEVER